MRKVTLHPFKIILVALILFNGYVLYGFNDPISENLSTDQFALIGHEHENGEFDFVLDLSIQWNLTLPKCAGDENGVISALIMGGTSPISYEWSTGETSPNPGFLALWDFNGEVPSDSPPTSVGEGEAFLLHGVENPSSGFSGSGSSDTASVSDAWQTTGYPAQGEDPRMAGVQFNISTENYNNLVFSFDQRLSNTASNTWVLEYTVDHTADPVVWEEGKVFRIQPESSGTGGVWHNERTFDFSEVEEINDKPNAAFRIVSDFDPTTGQYEAVNLGSSYSGGGTARFDMVGLFGNPSNRIARLENLAAGTYSITVVDGEGNQLMDSIQLPEPDSVPLPEIFGPREVESAQTATYTTSVGGEQGTELLWTVEGGVIDSMPGENEIVVRWDDVPLGEVGNGVVKTLFSNQFDCTRSYELPVVISGATSVSEDITKGSEFSLFPNPNRGQFWIEWQNEIPDGALRWEVFDYSGKKIESGKWSASDANGSTQLHINLPSTGLYQFLLRSERGEVLYSSKVVVME